MKNTNRIFAAREQTVLSICEKDVIVEIDSDGGAYTSYTSFFEANPNLANFKDLYEQNSFPLNTSLKLVGWGVHEHEALIIYVLQDPQTNKVYLYGADAAVDHMLICGYEAGFATEEEWLRAEHYLNKNDIL